MRMLILNCDFDRNIETNGAELIRLYTTFYGVKNTNILNIFESQFSLEAELPAYDGIVITGSRAAVYENMEWIKKLEDLVITIDGLGIPTLGICFGYQIVAQALGGKIEDSGKFTEGFESIELTPDGVSNVLFEGFPAKFQVYQSHGDIAIMIPENSLILAKSVNSLEAYKIREFICLQFHPEILIETAVRMAVRDGKGLNSVLNSDNYIVTPNILRNFIKYCNK